MRFVDCGDEPESLQPLKKWVNGERVWEPKGKEYSDFIKDLQCRFGSLCAYCERKCERPEKEEPKRDHDNTVDHFKPKAPYRFPELMHSWENLVYACHRCNQAKDDKFPGGSSDSPLSYLDLSTKARDFYGRQFVNPDCYVNPRDGDEPAEDFFAFNARGEIHPAEGLRNDEWSKAVRTIADLELNPKRGRISTDLVTQRATWWRRAKDLVREYPALAQMPRAERYQFLVEKDLIRKGFPFLTLVNWVLNHPD